MESNKAKSRRSRLWFLRGTTTAGCLFCTSHRVFSSALVSRLNLAGHTLGRWKLLLRRMFYDCKSIKLLVDHDYIFTNLFESSPHIKRSICRACQVPLLAGITSKTRLVNNSKLQTQHNDILVVECMVCEKKKRYPVGKETGSELWVDKAKRNNWTISISIRYYY